MSHPDEASSEEHAKFQLATRKTVLACTMRGYLPRFFDEAFPRSYKNSRKSVGIKGDRTIVPASMGRASLLLFGAVGGGFCHIGVSVRWERPTPPHKCNPAEHDNHA